MSTLWVAILPTLLRMWVGWTALHTAQHCPIGQPELCSVFNMEKFQDYHESVAQMPLSQHFRLATE